MMLQDIYNGQPRREASCLHCVWIADERQGGRLLRIWVDPQMTAFERQFVGADRPDQVPVTELASTLNEGEAPSGVEAQRPGKR